MVLDSGSQMWAPYSVGYITPHLTQSHGNLLKQLSHTKPRKHLASTTVDRIIFNQLPRVQGCDSREEPDRLDGSFPPHFRILAKSYLHGSELAQWKKRLISPEIKSEFSLSTSNMGLIKRQSWTRGEKWGNWKPHNPFLTRPQKSYHYFVSKMHPHNISSFRNTKFCYKLTIL